jgi:hypothetical protein
MKNLSLLASCSSHRTAKKPVSANLMDTDKYSLYINGEIEKKKDRRYRQDSWSGYLVHSLLAHTT